MTRHEPQVGRQPPMWDALPPAPSAPVITGVDPAVPQRPVSALVADVDWAAGPLGDPATWPQSLRTAVGICLSSRFPMVLWWGPELVMIYNDAYRPMLGCTKHPAALGARGKEVWPEIWDVIGPMLEHVMAGDGATWSRDQRLVLDRNGYPEECFFTFSYSPISDDGAGVGGVFCAVTETTERVLGERRLATLAEAAGLMGREHRPEVLHTASAILRGNPADHPLVVVADAAAVAPDLLDVVQEQLPGVGRATWSRVSDLARQVSATGRPAQVLADPDAVACGVRAWHAFPVDGERVRSVEDVAVIVLAEGVERPWDPALRAYAALFVGHVGAALREVTALSEERRRHQSLLELDRAKSEFFTNLSHELRTPLTLMSGPLQEAMETEQDLAQRRRLDLVGRAALRLERMVEAMLDFGRMEAGGVEPHLTAVDLTDLTRGLAEAFRPAAERAGLAFAHDCAEGVDAVVDRDMYERIVLNLLVNAVKYTPSGSVQLSLRVDDGCAEVAVRDTGIGIAAADVDRAFARFERLPARAGARSHEGAGIGLAMVKQLSELMGGSVQLASEVERGSTFTVRLPLNLPTTTGSGTGTRFPTARPRQVGDFLRELATWAQAPAPPLATRRLPGEDGGPSDAPPLRVVVAEDNADLRGYLGDVLGDLYDVELVPDGSAALDAVRRELPAIVVADVRMPGLDGYQLVDAIRQDPATRAVPVVLLSARAGDDATRDGLGAGADDYLVKPFSVVELRARISSNIERAEARSQDAAWRRAVMEGFHDPLVILDREGAVLEVNDRFTALLGWAPDDGPFAPPYPWDLAPSEGPDAGAGGRTFAEVVTAAARGARVGAEPVECVLTRRDGGRLVAAVRVSPVGGGRRQQALLLATVRDVTGEHEARHRRAAAARIAAELGSADELTDVVSAAIAGLGALLAGDATVQVEVAGRQQVFTASGPVTGGLPRGVVAALRSGVPDGSPPGPVDGILLTADPADPAAPAAPAAPADRPGRTGGPEPRYRVWVGFDRPREVAADERIAGDLLVQAFALACDRVVAAASFAQREQHLRRAIESHEEIGQAVGILVERHRITPTAAFERLKRASQDTNTKLREVAARVIESGSDPEGAGPAPGA